MTVKNADYYAGFREEQARQTLRAAGVNPADLAKQVARNLARDNASKQRILAGSPHLAALDVAEMSARELATHELTSYGIKVSDQSDPIEVRDAFHAGRMHERQRQGGGSNSAQDGGDSFVSRYVSGK